jgi:hypothetical protein
VPLAQLAHERPRRCGGALGEREQQRALGAEALADRAGRHAGLGGDLGERQLAGPEARHGAVRGGEDLLVADLPGARAHGA